MCICYRARLFFKYTSLGSHPFRNQESSNMHKKILIQTMLIDIYIIQGIFQSPIIFQMSKLVCITENVQIAISGVGRIFEMRGQIIKQT